MGEIRKHLRIYFLFIKSCIMQELEYRVNFYIGIAVEMGYLLAKSIYIVVVYSNDLHFNNLTPDGILLFIGTYTFMTGIYWCVFAINFGRIPGYIQSGQLDILITKPVSLQFLTTLRYIELGSILPNLGGGLIMISVAWSRLDLALSFSNIALFILFVILGLISTYSFFLIPYLISFWTVKADSLIQTSFALWDFNNMPMHIYNKWIQRFGMFVLPVFLITNPAPSIVLNMSRTHQIAGAVIVPFVLFFLTRILWNKALKRYSSANG